MRLCLYENNYYFKSNENKNLLPFSLVILLVFQVLYDTLVNRDDSPTIFVAMKDSQAYPKYWITFTKDN